jgi:hypothetical protein
MADPIIVTVRGDKGLRKALNALAISRGTSLNQMCLNILQDEASRAVKSGLDVDATLREKSRQREEMLSLWCQLYQLGYSATKIADFAGMNDITIYKQLAARGVQMRHGRPPTRPTEPIAEAAKRLSTNGTK